MLSPMGRVNELVSSKIGNTLSNIKTWGGVITNVKDYGAKGDYDPITGEGSDDTAAFIKAISVGGEIYVPPGVYKITDTIFINNPIYMNATYGSAVLYFTAENKTLFSCGELVSGSSATTYYNSIMDGLKLSGLGKDKNQNAIDLFGYIVVFKNMTIEKFKRGMNLSGVQVSLENMYFNNNEMGISIQDLPTASGVTYNTMVEIKFSTFVYNDLAINNRGDGQTLNDGRRNVINFYMDQNVFELNQQAFIIYPFNAKMTNCWFENNTIRPETSKYAWVLEKNHYSTNGGDNTINFVTNPDFGSTFLGIVDIQDGNSGYGRVSSRRYKFQNYNNSGGDISKRQLQETNRASVDSSLTVNDLNSGVDRDLLESNPMKEGATGGTNVLFNKVTRFSIKPDGTLYWRGHESSDTSYTIVTKLATGRYKVQFTQYGKQVIPNVFATSPTSIGGDGDQNNFYATTRMQCSVDNSAYSSFGTANILFVNTYSRAAGTVTDTLADAWIHITLFHN